MLMKGIFFEGGKKCTVALTSENISWSYESNPTKVNQVPSNELFSCWLCPKGRLQCYSQTSTCTHWKEGEGGGLVVELGERGRKRSWVAHRIVFRHESPEVLVVWREAVTKVIRGSPHRPHRLVVLINPVGGKGKGEHKYSKWVAPLFYRAGIQTNIKETEYRGHAFTLIKELDSDGTLDAADGVVVVGGDGMVSDVASALVLVAANKQGVLINDTQATLPQTSLRIGIIPSGSTDATCYATHGTNDVVTAALHIIMGDCRAIDAGGVYSEGCLQRVITTFASYGYFGDLLVFSERLRWMGPIRYLLSGLRQVLRNKTYNASIRVFCRRDAAITDSTQSYISADSIASCDSLCQVCRRTNIHGGPEECLWKEFNGEYSVLSAAVCSCACKMNPLGVSPTAHLGDGCTDLFLVKGSTRAKLISYLYHTGVTGQAATLPHVQMLRAKEVHFQLSSNVMSSWNCDGEELTSKQLKIKVHRQVIQMFCRGIEDIESHLTCSNQ